jgi:hypothetical protein
MMASLSNITLHQLFDWAGAIVLVSSVLNSFLPPYEWFDGWPRFQAVYKVLVMTIAKWGAINLKSVVYPSVTVPAQVQTMVDTGRVPVPTQGTTDGQLK